MSNDVDVVVIGGCGRVGLPLAIAFASRGLTVRIYDVSEPAVALVNQGRLPFDEPDAGPLLEHARTQGRLEATTNPAVVAAARNVVVVIGDPVNEHLNPDPQAIPRALRVCLPHFHDGQLLVLRSTVYPGVTRLVERMFRDAGLAVDVAFCPERIAEGHAMTELHTLPQIVAARSESGRLRATELFHALTDDVVHLDPEEAELAKLFTNAWRYIKFAAANQFYMIANDFGLDFERIRRALVHEYPRAADMPRAGFAAGPCLLKDTMQLAAFNNNQFHLGHSAMLINEGLPLYVVAQLEARYKLSELTVGILGAAFKSGSDDTRASLSYKLRRLLELKAHRVLVTDPHVTSDTTLVPLDVVLRDADVLIVATPHAEYHGLSTHQPVADVWGVVNGGVRV